MTLSDGKRRVQIILRVDQYNALRKQAKDTGAPLTELIRRAVDASLASKPQRKSA